MSKILLHPTPATVHIFPSWDILEEVYGESEKYVSLSFNQPYSSRVSNMVVIKVPKDFYNKEDTPCRFVAVIELVQEKRKYFSVSRGILAEDMERDVLYIRLPEREDTVPKLVCLIASIEGKHTWKSDKWVYNEFLTEKEPIYYKTATNMSSTGRHWLDMAVIISESEITLESKGNTPHAYGRRIFRLEVNKE